MDAEKLIEEAEALSNAATPGPWELEFSTERRRALSGAEPDAVVSPGVISDACVAVTHHGRYDADARFIARARTLVPELAAALRETTARAEKQKRQFDEALGNLMDGHAKEIRKRGLSNAVTAETYDACHAALRQTEEERDRERQRAAQLTAANVAANKRIEALEHERDAARAELARLTTPRPIAEAPKDGTWIVGFWDDAPPKVIRRWAEQWRDYMGASVAWRGLTHFLPLPVLP